MKKISESLCWFLRGAGMSMLVLITACSNSLSELPTATIHPSLTKDIDNYNYLIGSGDSLNVFVWGNPEVSGSYVVRPDGKITTSLVEDIPASGRTPTQLARDIEEKLAVYLKEPIVSVMVNNFSGPFSEQVRVLGEALDPKAISYAENMTLLDVMIQVGGLTEYADGNGASLVRIVDGKQEQYRLKMGDLLKEGDIKANVDILPGDIIIIPEAWY